MIDKTYIKQLAEQFIAGTDQFVVDVKLSHNKLGIYLDKPQGITLDECTALSRFLLQELEPSGFLLSHEVEVSSPGMDTPLMVPQQYLRRVGKEVSVIDNWGKTHKGLLKAAGIEGFDLIEVEERKENKKKIRTETLRHFQYSDVNETKLIINFKFK